MFAKYLLCYLPSTDPKWYKRLKYSHFKTLTITFKKKKTAPYLNSALVIVYLVGKRYVWYTMCHDPDIIQVLWVAEVHSVNIQVSRIPKRKKKSRIIWSTDRDVICSGVRWCVICPQTTNSSNSAPKGQHTWWKPHPEAKKIATLFLLKYTIFLKICVYSLEQSKLEKKTHTPVALSSFSISRGSILFPFVGEYSFFFFFLYCDVERES